MKYAFPHYNKEAMARAMGIALPISTKQSVEICSYIRGKALDESITILESVINKTHAVPFKRYNMDVGHRTGIGPGRYPVKSSTEIKQLLESVKSNAQQKGLNTSHLIITHICAHKAAKQWRYGRHRRRTAKRTHIEVVVAEAVESKNTEKKPMKIKPSVPVTEKATKEPSKELSKSPAKQPVKPPVKQPAEKEAKKSVEKPVKQPVKPPVKQPAEKPVAPKKTEVVNKKQEKPKETPTEKKPTASKSTKPTDAQ